MHFYYKYFQDLVDNMFQNKTDLMHVIILFGCDITGS